jgi:hypothetical protein
VALLHVAEQAHLVDVLQPRADPQGCDRAPFGDSHLAASSFLVSPAILPAKGSPTLAVF